MTQQQQERLERMQGVYGDEEQFLAVQERTLELIDQSFDLMRMIGGGRVSVLKSDLNLVAMQE